MPTKSQVNKLKTAIRKLTPLIKDARKRDLNETETANLVERFLERVFGYDLFRDISAEESVGPRSADYAIRIKGKPALIIEVKRIQSKLKDNHVYQVKNYAANLGVPWCVLTNGVVYRLYRITLGESLSHDLVFETNVAEDDPGGAAEKLWYLTRKGMEKKAINAYWGKKKSLSEESILKAVMSLGVLKAIRSQIRKETGQKISEVDIARSLKRMVSEELYSQYDELTAKVRRQKKKTSRRRKQAAAKAVATRRAQADQPAPPVLGPKPTEA